MEPDHSPTYSEALAGEIRAGIARAGATQGALAEAIQISQATLSRKLLGRFAFTVTELYDISHFLGIPASELMARAERQLLGGAA